MLPVQFITTEALSDFLKYTLVRGIELSDMGLKLEFATLNGQPVILSYSHVTKGGGFSIRNDSFESSKNSNYFSGVDSFAVALRATSITLGLQHKSLDFSIAPLNYLLRQLLDGEIPFSSFFIESKKGLDGVYSGAVNKSQFEICNIRPKLYTWSMLYKSDTYSTSDMTYEDFITHLVKLGSIKE